MEPSEWFSNASTSTAAVDECAIESNDRRWYFALVGTGCSIVSILTNMIIARVLLSRRHSHFFFLGLLALSDCFLSINYGPVIAMDIIKDRLQILWLTRLYQLYVGPLLGLCSVSMAFSSYLIILATIERFLITQRSSWLGAFRRHRGLSAFGMFLLALLMRGPIIFESELKRNGECTGLTEYYIDLHSIVHTFLYGTVYRFYIRNIMTVFVPFGTLALLNYCIVRTLRMQQRSAEMFRFLSSDHKASFDFQRFQSKIRSATRLMVLVVCSYLLANVINVLVTLWEYVAFQSTQDGVAYLIYEICTDVTSVLYVFVCATRIFVYYALNKEIRDAMMECACGFPRLPRKSDYIVVTRSFDSSRHIGTEIDAVAIAIARRLMSNELLATSKSNGQLDDDRVDSPLQAIVIANRNAGEPPRML
ncbi:unnamed protein product [Caenorhabditis auriculariae]|uniref:G-protein coupled receptors family 1 profile domain-containing protein n=1 Tax=Caenorhabditis auriculariae TaxID=2777116 RepID=A0A8S1HK08_9PELO|nr:unnamed protein product [Caenorhabditis auriculariae]